VLSEEDARKVAKFVRLLGSDNEHEVYAAAKKMKEALAKSGMNLSDLGNVLEQLPKIISLVNSGAAFKPAPPPEPEKSSTIDTVGDAVRYAYEMRGKLLPREQEFIESVTRQYDAGKTLTQKQVDWLKIIAQKLMRRYGYRPQESFHDI